MCHDVVERTVRWGILLSLVPVLSQRSPSISSVPHDLLISSMSQLSRVCSYAAGLPDVMLSFAEWKRSNPSAYGATTDDGHKHDALPTELAVADRGGTRRHSPERKPGPEFSNISSFFEDDDAKLGSSLPPASTLTVGRDGKPLKTAMARAESSLTKRLPKLRS